MSSVNDDKLFDLWNKGKIDEVIASKDYIDTLEGEGKIFWELNWAFCILEQRNEGELYWKLIQKQSPEKPKGWITNQNVNYSIFVKCSKTGKEYKKQFVLENEKFDMFVQKNLGNSLGLESKTEGGIKAKEASKESRSKGAKSRYKTSIKRKAIAVIQELERALGPEETREFWKTYLANKL